MSYKLHELLSQKRQKIHSLARVATSSVSSLWLETRF
jgi:hypothetical protein